jgi:ethanolamine ammonia-lyase small subunit
VSPGRLEDPWRELRALTPARIALGRAGGSLPTAELLSFEAAHAAAKDAVWSALDEDALERDLRAAGLAAPVLRLRSAAPDRQTYLQRPDLGRRLAPESEARLAAFAPHGFDVVLVLADGLSATAARRHGPALAAALAARLRAQGLVLGPLCVASQARVAIEDAIGAALGAKLAVILLGERPGLLSPDSLGAYLVHGPRPGRTDADRNCVSNVRPEGLPLDAAAELVTWLAVEALRRGLSGVVLKDERLAAGSAPPRLVDPR